MPGPAGTLAGPARWSPEPASSGVTRPAWLVAVMTLLALFVPPSPLIVAHPVFPAAAAGADSISVRREAMRAQAAFERERVGRLPWAGWGPSGACDEIVGRFCYRHESGSDYEPPPEDPAVAAARERLLALLADAAATLPGDEWIAGQRVRYLVEAGRPREAAAAARAFRGAADWRLALEGYALHADGDFAAAESAFDAALARMPSDERAQWTDPSLLLDSRLAGAWRELGPAERDVFERRVWWLADPLWSVPGNERRAEHFARHVVDRLQSDARSPYDTGWGADLRELTIRYGWPVGWERARPRSGALAGGGRPPVVAHDAPAARAFVPPHAVFQAPADAAPESWPLSPPKPRSTYAPSYADSMADLPHQLAVFRRAGRAAVVAAYEPPADGARASLFVWRAPDETPAVASDEAQAGGQGFLLADAPWDPAVVSLEVRGHGRAARSRYGLRLPAAPATVSDVLLLADGPGPLPGSLEQAAARARTTVALRSGQRVTAYFEVYPIPGETGPARLSLSVREGRGGWRRRLARLLAGGAGEAAVSWTEPLAGDGGIHGRTVTVTLPELPEGRHALVLEVELPGGSRVEARREIEITRGGG